MNRRSRTLARAQVLASGQDAIIRPEYNGECEGCGKHRYPSERAARRAARRLEDGMQVYLCKGWWHVGGVIRPRIRKGSGRNFPADSAAA